MTGARATYTELDDDALAQASRTDAMALDVLLQRHAPTAVRIAFAVLGQREDALDAAQEALTKTACNLNTSWSGRCFKAWLCALARSAAVDLLRNRTSRTRREDEAAAGRPTEHNNMVQADPLGEELNPLLCLREELAALPDETANALLLHHLEGRPVLEVAQQLGVSADACKQRLHRGRERLRERLEQRGVRLASVAALAALIDEVRHGSEAVAGELSDDTVRNLARNAKTRAAKSTSGATSPLDPDASAKTAFESPPRPADPLPQPGRPSGRSPSMLNRIAPAAAVILLAAIFVSVFRSSPQTPVADAPTPTVPAMAAAAPAKPLGVVAPPTASPKPAGPAAAATRQQEPEAAAPRWQPPRFLSSDLEPKAISAAGRFVAIVVGSSDLASVKGLATAPLQLLESSDGGATWTPGDKFPDFNEMEVAVDAAGNCAVAGVTGAPPLPKSDDKFALNFPHPKRAEYRFRPAGGQFSAAQTIWSEADGSQRYYTQPRIFLVKDAVWVFALKPQDSTLMHHVAARGDGRTCPQPLKEWAGGGETVAWAGDAQNAGFCISTAEGVQHVFTSDGGKNWSTVPINFGQDPGSNRQYELVEPVNMTHEGSNLYLLLNAEYQLDPKDVMSHTNQNFILPSTDLGRTWGVPVVASTAQSLMDGVRFGPYVHAFNGNVALGFYKTPGFKAVLEQSKAREAGQPLPAKPADDVDRVELRTSANGGAAWFDQHAFDGFTDNATAVRVGGDEHSLHVAVAKNGQLIIRSFTAGDWPTVKDTPSWYKEQPTAAPSRDDF